MKEILGQVIGGNSRQILIRVKAGAQVMLGTLATIQEQDTTLLFQVVDLLHGSQISDINRQFLSGISLEENSEDMELIDAEQRNYVLASLKPLVSLCKDKVVASKSLPALFSEVTEIDKNDFTFLSSAENPLIFGNLRSGSIVLEQPVCLNGTEIFSHHILIAAQTGKGKSNLTKCLLWRIMQQKYCGILILDAHDEYYGTHRAGLSSYVNKDVLLFYSPQSNAVPGSFSLTINLKDIYPSHLSYVAQWSEPQHDFLYAAHNKFGSLWIEKIITSSLDTLLNIGESEFRETTVQVVKRRLQSLLHLETQKESATDTSNNRLVCKSIFQSDERGATTIHDICAGLEKAKTVIIDTASLKNSTELIVGVIIASKVFSKYQYYKREGELEQKPSISFVIEEAPRVLGKDVLEKNHNIFPQLQKKDASLR